jgi:Cu/Ag efflux pump CusA
MELERRHRVADIENVLLSQTNVAPTLVKDVAKVTVSHVSRLGKAGRAGALPARRNGAAVVRYPPNWERFGKREA